MKRKRDALDLAQHAALREVGGLEAFILAGFWACFARSQNSCALPAQVLFEALQ